MLYIYTRGPEEQHCLKIKAQELGSKEYTLKTGKEDVFKKLLQEVQEGDDILVHEAYRLFNSHYEMMENAKKLKSKGVRIYDFYTGQYITDEELGLRLKLLLCE